MKIPSSNPFCENKVPLLLSLTGAWDATFDDDGLAGTERAVANPCHVSDISDPEPKYSYLVVTHLLFISIKM